MGTWAIATEPQFLAFYNATIGDAHRYASRLVGSDGARAEDLVQDVYLGLLRSAKAGSLKEVGVGWVLVAIRHRFLDGLRGADREERRLRLVWSRAAAETSEVEIAGGVLSGVQLNDRERAALILRYVDDLPVAEVAAALGTTVRGAESLLARARVSRSRFGGAEWLIDGSTTSCPGGHLRQSSSPACATNSSMSGGTTEPPCVGRWCHAHASGAALG